MTDHNVSLDSDGDCEPGRDTDTHVEEVMRHGVEIRVRTHSPLVTNRKQQYHQEVTHVCDQLKLEEKVKVNQRLNQ